MRFIRILDYLYPPRCPVCDRICADGVCEACGESLPYINGDFCLKCGKPLRDGRQEYCGDCQKKRHAYVQGRSLLSYQGAVKQSLYRLKYANRREYALWYGEEIARRLGPWIRRAGITRIVPVPLHRARRRRRGYNQAELLARSIGRSLNLPVDGRLLARVKRTMPQKTLSGRQRKENLKGAFRVQKTLTERENILLVDDIYTTGSTVDAAAECLNRTGKCRVYVVTAAIGG